MKKNGYLRSFLALFLAFVMIMADSSVTTFAATVGRVRKQKAVQKFEPGESVSYTEILGNAVYFGIVANTVNKQAHMDSNFATKVLNGASGNVTTGAYTENGAVYLVASVPNGGVLEMDGKSNILWCPEENRNNFKVKGTIETYPKETLDAYVDSMINHVSQKSTTIGNRNGYIVDNLANSKTIDIENCEAGTYYFDMSNYAQYGIDDLKIKKKSNQVVVLNYPTSNKVTLKRFELVNDGVSVSSATSNQTVDKLCRSIIFNMPQATEIDFASATAGLFIAPKATVTGLGGTSSGWIVVNSFTNNGGEWHCVYGELPKPENVEKPAQESFSVSKTVDGSTPTVDQKFVFRLEQIGDVPNGTTPISAKTVENNGAKVDFGTIKYNKEGTYYYRITETGKAATTSGEYTLDSQSYVVKIVVTANVTSSGNITTTEYNKVTTYYKGDTVNACTEENKVTGTTGITFNNETIEQKGNLKIVKAAGAGTNLVGKTFYFKISDENGNVVKNSNNSDVWSITFSANVENAINIENLEPGKYRVSETDANGNGVTTGEAFPYVVTGGGLVTVEGNKTANVVVTNTKYEAAGSLVLTAEKKLEGKQLEAGKYSFVLKDSKGTELQTKQNSADGSVSFDAIEYTLADAGKDFTYAVAEVAGNEAGVTYDSSVYTVKVHVADKGTGTLEVTKKITRTAGEKTEEAEKIVFNNKYEAAGSLALTAEKKLEGKQLKEGKYSFVLKDSKGTELQTKQNGADGSVSFDAIEYTLADAGKDFTYTVAEVAGNEAGVTYDSSVYTVKVHVADKGTGTLEVTKKITRTAGEKTEEAEKIVFNNKYEAAGSLALTAEKKLEGKQLEAGKYSFVLKDSKGTELQTKQNGADGSVSFDAIEYTLADAGKDFTYAVAEVAGNEAGVTYDSSVYTVKVHVADKGTGTLEVTKKITRTAGEKTEEAEKIVFNNKYEAAGSLALTAEKKLEGKQLEAGKYSFVLKDSKGTELQTKQNSADGSVSFDAIEYTLADAGKDFTYAVAEVAGNEAGVTYDSSVYTVKVHVADKGTGTLEVTKKITRTAGEKTEEAEKIVFNNKYEAAGSLVLTAEKKLEGKQLEAGKYSFVLKDSKGTELQTKQNSADGSVSFDAIEYTLADAGKDFTYAVAEVAGNEAGVTYDSSVYTVKVHVADKGTGTLEVTKKITRTAGEKTEEAEKIVFNNKYEAAGSLALTAEKKLEGKQLKEGKYSFVLKDSKGTELQTKQNGADGSVSFDAIEYTLADAGKDFTYTVAEVAGNEAGVTYDSSVYTVKVHVADKGTGTLEVTKKITRTAGEKTEEAEKIVFNNKYEAAGSLALTAEKKLEGKQLEAGKYSFVLKDSKGTELQTKQNGADGSVSFDAIEYTLADAGKDFTYAVAEVAGNEAGVTYDSSVYTVKVHVADKGTGTLEVTKKITRTAGEKTEEAEKIVFNNKYEAAGSLALTAEKKLEGKQLEAGKYSFVLKDSKGTELQTKQNGADGSVSFDAIEYTLADAGKDFTYAVAEVAGNEAGVTYDSSVYTVKVHVADKGTGTLEVTKKITRTAGEKTEEAEKIVFNNKYEAAGSLALTAEKKLEGKQLKEGKYSFVLKDSKGTELQTKQNGADGSVSFDAIEYTLADAGKDFTYAVAEVAGNEAGVTYDSSVYTVKVHVADKGTGTLEVTKKITRTAGEKTEEAEKIVFNNKYEAAGSLALTAEKKLEGKQLKEGKYSFVLKDSKGTELQTKQNGADGSVSFDAIEYTLADAGKDFTYTVAEVAGSEAGVTYDSSVYTVKVHVADKGTGTLEVTKKITRTAGEKTEEAEKIVFNNKYEANGSITLTATKNLNGREFRKGDKWTFTVTCDDANAPMPEHPVVTTTATSGFTTTLDFGKINYTIADAGKSYVYIITETGNVANVTNDPVAARTVTVSVRDKGDGTLNVTQEVTGAGLTFTNKYADGETTLGVTKVLSGREFKSGDEWTFKLTADKGTPMPAQTVVKTDATSGNSQSLSFGTIKYTLADVGNTYTYTIHETGSAEGVTNDPNATRIVTVTVNEGKDGKLDIVREEPKGEIVFTNTYDAKGSLTLEASKTLKNKALEADAFNFVLKDKNGETIQTVANDADGNVTFSPLNYTLKDVGTHVYTVSEVQRENTEVTYDTTEYTVEVTVADAGNGKLKVSKTIKKGDDTVDAIAFENIYKGVIDISGSKTWNDADNQDGIRPASITVKLFANGTEAASQVVTPDEAGNWNYVFKNLPQYDAKGKITYTVTESAVAGYETSVSGYNITNTHKPETLDITGTKTWNDSNNQDGKRPKSITVNLLANGIITDTKTVTADDNWTYSFTDLPKYANGQEITYTVSELTVPGYTTTIDDNYNITNSYTPGETSASVTKIWDDADNQDGIRPESITVALLANGTPTNKTVTLTAANNWTQTITGLPEKADGEYITYTWTEVNVPEGYSLTGTSKNETVTTLTNTHTPELTSITGTKTWKDADNQDGKRPESITVNLFADGTKLKSQSVSADADGNWSYSFTDLPKYANGQEITYTVTEDAVDGYTTESDGYNFINTHQPETTEITGTKTWNDANNQDGKRPESITVILLANGTEKTRQAVTADEAGNWTYTFKDLPKYANGQEITYTVAEEEVTDYTTTYDGSNITNSYTPGKTSATVTKIWNDAENQDGKRPESITVSLLADGKETGKTVTLSVENNWKQTISDLPEKADGKAIEYTWTEETLPEGYELTDNSKNGTVTTLTNTYAPETTSITVTKTWDDADNQDGKRPESIIVNLLANGEIVASQTVKADEAGNWTYTFKDLPKYANGKEITYTVTEEAVEGYETSVDGFNITNTYTTETTEMKGSKTWNDADNQDGKRPESITVRLLANGEEKDSQTVTADENGNWTYSFEKLPKYEAGKEIVYTVTEDAVADYTTEITGYDITNSYAPGKTSVTVTKSWADNDDRGGHRPKEIKVQLKADGENSGEEITLNAENKWTYTWSELDEKKSGKDIVYTVEEIGKTAGYISTVTGNVTEGFIVTNTITSVKISKVDITDQKELAGAHIQILDKDGNVVDEWDSTWESHEVTGLKTGEKYTLRETVAPDGYTITADTVFSLKEDGTLDKDNTSTTISADGTLLVEDSRTSVKVSKVDISDGEELEGAHIQIIDQDGNVVDEWDSTKEAHVTEKLKTGKIYTLRETVAPDGYLLTSDTTFVLKEDGTVDAEKTTAVSKDGVLLVQDKLATAASIAVTKKLTYIGENLAARDQTFYVALYSDKECTQRVSDVKALVFKNADASTVVFSENIKAGKTYYIAECTQDGTSQTIGALADGTVYEAVFGNGNSTTVTEANGTTTVSFENVFSSFPPDGFYKQGQLTITKKVLGADGGTRNSNEVFYAGIFDDAAHTQLSQQVEQNIIKLDMDGGYEVSEIINVGLAQSGAKVTLYVTETDSNGKPIAGSEGFGYKVTVSADSVTFDETNMTAEVVITNQEESTVTETPTPTPTPSSDGGNSGGSEDHSGGYGGGKSPKTGDDTPIGTYLMLLLAAAMLVAETERRRRRNKRQ